MTNTELQALSCVHGKRITDCRPCYVMVKTAMKPLQRDLSNVESAVFAKIQRIKQLERDNAALRDALVVRVDQHQNLKPCPICAWYGKHAETCRHYATERKAMDVNARLSLPRDERI